MSEALAPKNIYDLCNEVYAHRGQYGVYDFVGQFTNIQWTYCSPCEQSTPFDPYDNPQLGYEVTCLVCGTHNPYVEVGAVKVLVLYENGNVEWSNIDAYKSLAFLQKKCGGYVEAHTLLGSGLTLWLNEESRINNKGHVPNFNATKLWSMQYNDSTVLLGNVVVTSSEVTKDGYPTSLTRNQVTILEEQYPKEGGDE